MAGRIITNETTGEKAWWDGVKITPLRPEEQRMAANGFLRGSPNAPDKIAARQEYATGQKALAEDAAAYKRVAPLRTQLSRFEQLNTDPKAGTGGFMENLPWGLSGAYANLKGGPASELASIGAGMQVNDIPKNQGQISNFERSLFALGQPGIEKKGPINQNIIHQKQALFNQEGDRLAFMQAYLDHNQTLNGAAEAWDGYVGKHPYAGSNLAGHKPGTVSYFDPATRVGWQDYFGVAPPKTTRPAGAPKAASVAARAPRKAAADPFPGIREGQIVQQGGKSFRRQGAQMVPLN